MGDTYRVDGRMTRRRFSTKKQALDALAQARVDTAAGTAVLPVESKVTVSAYGSAGVATLQVRPSTRAMYDNHLRVHIGPLLGHRPLSALRRSDVAAFVAVLVDGGLAPSTVRSIDNVLSMLLRSAVYDRLLAVSTCYRIKVPASTRRTLQVLSPAQVRLLLDAAWDCDHALLARQGLAAGQLQRVGVEADPAARRAAAGLRLPRAPAHLRLGLIAEDVHSRLIQARLGHTSITETMDTCGHLFLEAHEETAQPLDRLFGSDRDEAM